jgi:hypothetical protein
MENNIASLEAATTLILNAWKTQVNAVTDYFNKYPEAFYQQPVSPGRNTAHALLGHLVANTDGLNPLLGFGEKLFPQLDAFFQPNTPWDQSGLPPVAELKWQWEHLNRSLEQQFTTLTPADWMGRHTRVSEADFALDPKRNKLNVLISRTNHVSYHLGQLNLIK